ncbi:MAG: hypothetical protein A2135_10490 [Actinobacteria bacterium RBG_16_67_15]|nr:MAG: hypothetical protein A2135_10490 [Actinobacteria bacterium RBG_16_67_15]
MLGGLARTVLLDVERLFGRLSPAFVVITGLLLLALIGLVDAVTGAFSVSVFYLVPIGLVTFARGRWVGVAMVAAGAAAWGAVELGTGVTTFESGVTYWNFLTRFYMLEAVSLLVAPTRDVVLWEREVAEREADAAEHLRALTELRAAMEYGDLGASEVAEDTRLAAAGAELSVLHPATVPARPRR